MIVSWITSCCCGTRNARTRPVHRHDRRTTDDFRIAPAFFPSPLFLPFQSPPVFALVSFPLCFHFPRPAVCCFPPNLPVVACGVVPSHDRTRRARTSTPRSPPRARTRVMPCGTPLRLFSSIACARAEMCVPPPNGKIAREKGASGYRRGGAALLAAKEASREHGRSRATGKAQATHRQKVGDQRGAQQRSNSGDKGEKRKEKAERGKRKGGSEEDLS